MPTTPLVSLVGCRSEPTHRLWMVLLSTLLLSCGQHRHAPMEAAELGRAQAPLPDRRIASVQLSWVEVPTERLLQNPIEDDEFHRACLVLEDDLDGDGANDLGVLSWSPGFLREELGLVFSRYEVRSSATGKLLRGVDLNWGAGLEDAEPISAIRAPAERGDKLVLSVSLTRGRDGNAGGDMGLVILDPENGKVSAIHWPAGVFARPSGELAAVKSGQKTLGLVAASMAWEYLSVRAKSRGYLYLGADLVPHWREWSVLQAPNPIWVGGRLALPYGGLQEHDPVINLLGLAGPELPVDLGVAVFAAGPISQIVTAPEFVGYLPYAGACLRREGAIRWAVVTTQFFGGRPPVALIALDLKGDQRPRQLTGWEQECAETGGISAVPDISGDLQDDLVALFESKGGPTKLAFVDIEGDRVLASTELEGLKFRRTLGSQLLVSEEAGQPLRVFFLVGGRSEWGISPCRVACVTGVYER
jgi:hypothetical protein